MRRFIRKTAVFGLIILFSLAGVNYFGDAAKIFSNTYEKKMVSIALEHTYVTNFSNYDERIFQEYLIKNAPVTDPQTVVLGSSRTALINSDFLDREPILNSSVNGASIEDLVSIYQIYKEEDKLPEHFIIGVDPWTFNANNNQERWKSLSPYYHRFHGRDDSAYREQREDKLLRYKELFSFSYFQSSIRTLMKRIVKVHDPVPSAQKYNEGDTKADDGSRILRESFREADKEEVTAKVQAYVADDIYSIENFHEIDEQAWNDFEMLMQELRDLGISSEIYLFPYHPKAYEVIQSYEMVKQTEKRVKDFSQAYDIPIYGSFDPSRVGINLAEEDFYDAMHCKEKAVESIIRTL